MNEQQLAAACTCRPADETKARKGAETLAYRSQNSVLRTFRKYKSPGTHSTTELAQLYLALNCEAPWICRIGAGHVNTNGHLNEGHDRRLGLGESIGRAAFKVLSFPRTRGMGPACAQ